jgi:hypothetical protein
MNTLVFIEGPLAPSIQQVRSYRKLEYDRTSYASSFVKIRHELSVMMFSNAKDKAWSQHKHLHDLGYLEYTTISLHRF